MSWLECPGYNQERCGFSWGINHLTLMQAPQIEQRAIRDSQLLDGSFLTYLKGCLVTSILKGNLNIDLSLSQIACGLEMQRMTMVSTFQSCVCHTELSQSDPCQLCSHNLTWNILQSSPSPQALAMPHPTLVLQCVITF